MVQSQFCLSWDSHKSSLCNGFSALQQNGEFVDMTVAADGHFVKVHKMVMALASPYLKELITSAPCQHPVIFLNNVSYKALCSLLEYIYTGEALIPAEGLTSFIETAKALHIKGLESMNSSECLPVRMAVNVAQLDGTDFRNMAAAGLEKTEHMNIPVTRKFLIKPEMQSTPEKLRTASTEVMTDYDPAQDSDDGQNYGNPPTSIDSQGLSVVDNSDVKERLPTNLQFTVSIRGSLQVILNRYIYNLHSVTHRTGVRRWRCVDYRNHKCMAFVVSKNNVVLSRGNLHNHPFHDKKILSKIEKNTIYSAIDDVEGYKGKEPTEYANKDDCAMDMEQEFPSLDFSEDNGTDSIMKNS